MELKNNYKVNRIIINYIFYYGENKSKAVKVSNIIINMIRNKTLDKKDVENELEKSKIFKSYKDLVEFRKMVKSNILNIISNIDIDTVEKSIFDPEFMHYSFNKLFLSIDTDSRYFKFYRKEFINDKDTKV